MIVLVCNAGSTSLKFKLYEMPQCVILAQSKIERVGSLGDAIFQYSNRINECEQYYERQSIPDYRSGITMFLDTLTSQSEGVISSVYEIDRVGYKTTLSKGYFGVHELTNNVLRGMSEWLPLAPLHNAAYIETINTMRDILPAALFIGVFETGFHMDIHLERKIFGVPYEWYETYGVQKLGYHGASHGYIADCLNDKGLEYRAISCHLGGSCSICAIKNGKSVDNSFGMSLQSGIIHANRVGDMDCDLTEFLRSERLSEEEIHEGLVKKGGLLGISGVSNDLRYIEKAASDGNKRAKLAIDVFVNGIVHYIGAYYVELGGLEYLVFTGGIGENSSKIRNLVCNKLGILGVALDSGLNSQCKGFGVLSRKKSKVSILVIPADEELAIARRTYEYDTNS